MMSRPLLIGLIFFRLNTGFSLKDTEIMTVSKLSVLNTGSDLFNYLAVNEVGSPAKEELNLFLWLLCQEVCGYVYG